MSDAIEPIRTFRLAYDLPINAGAERTFEVMTQQMFNWRPRTYGGERTRRVVLEPRVGGAHYEDWGAPAGHLSTATSLSTTRPPGGPPEASSATGLSWTATTSSPKPTMAPCEST